MFFIVSVAFEYLHTPPKASGENLWEEEFVVVEADNDEIAERRALEMYKPEGESYKGADGDLVTVIPRFAIGAYWLDNCFSDEPITMSSGKPLFSRFLRQGEAYSLREKFGEDEL